MQTIWKYPIPIDDEFLIDLPAFAEVLDIQVQNDVPCMWVKVDPTAGLIPRKFRVFGTGHDVVCYDGEYLDHLATFQYDKGRLVFHVFEVKQR